MTVVLNKKQSMTFAYILKKLHPLRQITMYSTEMNDKNGVDFSIFHTPLKSEILTKFFIDEEGEITELK